MKGKVTIMAYSIYDSFLTVSDCKYYCNQLAKKLNLSTYDYFYDKYSEMQFPSDSNIYGFEVLKEYENWRIRFNLTKPKTIKKMGIEEYVSKNKELIFNLTSKGVRFLYICKFSNSNNDAEDNPVHAVLDNHTKIVYIEEDSGQLSFIL